MSFNLLFISELSAKRGWDDYYVIPPEIHDFIYLLNSKLRNGYYVKPWTINRAITVFSNTGKRKLIISYEAIELGIMNKYIDNIIKISEEDNNEAIRM